MILIILVKIFRERLKISANDFQQTVALIDYCGNTVCENGATCVNNLGGNDYECVCLNGFSGKNCSTNDDDCMENSCAAGSTCIDGIAKYYCLCPPGKLGLLKILK